MPVQDAGWLAGRQAGRHAGRLVGRQASRQVGRQGSADGGAWMCAGAQAAAAAKNVYDIVRDVCPTWRQNQTEICRCHEMLQVPPRAAGTYLWRSLFGPHNFVSSGSFPLKI